jgi:hypothetical protein
MAVTDQRDIYNMFVEKKIDELDGMFSTMKSRLERTIAALHYVRLELSNGECVGVNPHKFSVSDEPAVEVEKVLYAAVIDNKRGRSTLVKGTPEILQQSFKKAIDAMAQAEERDKKILLIQEMEAERECSEFRRVLAFSTARE